MVADQRGNPTSALDIADGDSRRSLPICVADSDPDLRGVFHMTASGEASWADFAEAIFAASADAGGPTAQVRRIAHGRLSDAGEAAGQFAARLHAELAQVHGVRLPDWRDVARSRDRAPAISGELNRYQKERRR